MSNDAISRGGLLAEIHKQNIGQQMDSLVHIGMIVNDMPALDVQPVVHARWIERDMWYTDMQCDCSACGAKLHVPTCMGKPMYKYCPDCGARMDAEV